MRVLILGAYGMLGHKMFQHLSKQFDVWGTCRKKEEKFLEFIPFSHLIENVDALNVESVFRAIEEVSTDILKLEDLSDGLIREILNLA